MKIRFRQLGLYRKTVWLIVALLGALWTRRKKRERRQCGHFGTAARGKSCRQAKDPASFRARKRAQVPAACADCPDRSGSHAVG